MSEIAEVCQDKGIDIVVIIAKSGEKVEQNIRCFVKIVDELKKGG